MLTVSNSFASEKTDLIKNTIESLGLSYSQFSDMWPLYCKPHWKNIYMENLLKTSEFVINAKKSGFLSVKYENDTTYLSPGKTCKALMEYYYEGKFSNSINNFITKDKKIKKQFGFSSLDLYKTSANYVESYYTYDWLIEDLNLLEKTIKRHMKENTFVIEVTIKNKASVKKDGEFKEIDVKPYKVYYLRPSKALIQAHEKINS